MQGPSPSSEASAMALTEPTASAKRRQSERHGRRAERIAAWYLRAKLYRIIARRWRTPVGEIDLVAKRGRTLAFIEVKTRATDEAAVEAITMAARVRIARAAQVWLTRYPAAAATLSLRFDVIVVARARWPRHIRSAFDGAGQA